jgi:hypothetical protein
MTYVYRLLILFLFSHYLIGQVSLGPISQISEEKINTLFCFNNTSLMAGNTATDRYIVYYSSDSIFLTLNQSGIWTRKIAHTGNNIQSATTCFFQDTIWICWKEGNSIKAHYTSDKGASWSTIYTVSQIGNASAPSVYAGQNGKIHFVWSLSTLTDTLIYYRSISNNAFDAPPVSISNIGAQGLWPSIVCLGDTVLCTWKEQPLPAKVWFRSSYSGGTTWNASVQPTTALTNIKDPNLAVSVNPITQSYYTFLAYDGSNKIYLQRSSDWGTTWSSPDLLGNPNKLCQFAHIECNNSGFVGVSYEYRNGGTIFDDTKKDVGFIFSSSYADPGSFGNDSLAYTYNPLGSLYTAIDKIDSTLFFLSWLTKDTINNKVLVFERSININPSSSDRNTNGNPTKAIDIYPNPTESEIHFKTNSTNLLEIVLYNIWGEICGEYNQPDFSIKDLPSGVYLCKITTHDGCSFARFIKK